MEKGIPKKGWNHVYLGMGRLHYKKRKTNKTKPANISLSETELGTKNIMYVEMHGHPLKKRENKQNLKHKWKGKWKGIPNWNH